jgi:hypothetical protein
LLEKIAFPFGVELAKALRDISSWFRRTWQFVETDPPAALLLAIFETRAQSADCRKLFAAPAAPRIAALHKLRTYRPPISKLLSLWCTRHLVMKAVRCNNPVNNFFALYICTHAVL